MKANLRKTKRLLCFSLQSDTLTLPVYYSFDSAEASQQTEAALVNRGASFQKRHAAFLINVTTCSYEVFAGIKVKLTGELSANLS